MGRTVTWGRIGLIGGPIGLMGSKGFTDFRAIGRSAGVTRSVGTGPSGTMLRLCGPTGRSRGSMGAFRPIRPIGGSVGSGSAGSMGSARTMKPLGTMGTRILSPSVTVCVFSVALRASDSPPTPSLILLVLTIVVILVVVVLVVVVVVVFLVIVAVLNCLLVFISKCLVCFRHVLNTASTVRQCTKRHIKRDHLRFHHCAGFGCVSVGVVGHRLGELSPLLETGQTVSKHFSLMPYNEGKCNHRTHNKQHNGKESKRSPECLALAVCICVTLCTGHGTTEEKKHVADNSKRFVPIHRPVFKGTGVSVKRQG